MKTSKCAFGVRGGCLIIATLVAALVPSEAFASPLFELAGGVTGTGGFNARVTGAGAPSTYFNPSLLPQAKQGFELGVMVLTEQISMELDPRTGGSNVPVAVGNRDLTDPSGKPISNATMPTDWLQNGCPIRTCNPAFAARRRQSAGSSGVTRAYQVIGLVNRIIDNKLVLGFHAIVPLGKFTTANSFYNDEREQFFSNSLHPELYADRMTATSLAFGVGSQLAKTLSLGLSFTLNLTNSAQAGTYVRDAENYNKLLLATNVDVQASVSPHLGLTFTPTDWLSLSGTMHSRQQLTIVTAFNAILPGGNESSTKRTAVHDYLPWIFGLGGQVDLNSKKANHHFAVAGSMQYSTWSGYLDRHGESPNDYGNYLAWNNMLSGSLGLRHGHKKTRTFVDFTVVPSPVPDQTGPTNYVDNDRIGMSLGGDTEFELFGLHFRAGAQIQTHRLIYRHQTKLDYLVYDELPDNTVTSTGEPAKGAKGLQTNNPGWPGYASHGWIYGGTLSLSLLY
jgi:long-chain fatty acid transport protein